MAALFAVTRTHESAWDALRLMDEQDAWEEHAGFMDSLHNNGFVVFGGPLADGPEVLLIVKAEESEEITETLNEYPWSKNDLLPVTRIAPWTLCMRTL